jgi:hypothetical protein
MMRKNGILIILLVCTLILSVDALTPDSVIVTTNHPWLVAGDPGTATITVRVVNASNPDDPVVGTNVSVSCEGGMGTIQPPSTSRIDTGSTSVSFIFAPGTKSGNATLHIRITHPALPTPLDSYFVQKIDHAAPSAYADLIYPAQMPVGSLVTIQARLKDRYGNIVNSLREDDELLPAESISFRDSVDGDGGFLDESTFVDVLNASVNETGYASVQYRLASLAGDNLISVQTPATVSPALTFISIKGFGVLSTFISAEVTPSSYVVYANNQDVFSILYSVKDMNGNPIRNATIIRSTSLGEVSTFKTNEQGQVMTTYGPKSSIGTVTVIATVEGYPNMIVVNTLEFIHTDPVMWVLTASPQILASRDVKDDITADIKAKVMDILGNPVENETITFSIQSVSGTTSLTTQPELVDTSATTDLDGYAIVQLRPGAFPGWGEAGYSQNATGTATVRATWDGRTKDIIITFKNYPYLRVETTVSPQTVGVNETADVTVRLIGDGWALRPKPIDVVLVTDRSGSMLKDEPDDRMVPVMDASRTFATAMDLSQSQDHIGLVSFGTKGIAKIAPILSGGSWDWNSIYGGHYGTSPLESNPGWWWVGDDNAYDSNPNSYSSSSVHAAYVAVHYPANPHNYNDYAIIDVPLNWSPSAINTSINSMVPSGGTPMRFAIYQGINEIAAHGRSGAVRALVVLSDGDYNYYGDPLARGTGSSSTPCSDPTSYSDLTTSYCKLSGLNSSTQNLSSYAQSKNVRIYAIGYASDISVGGKNTLRILAESTGGKYYDGDAANIGEIYQTIAGDLRTVAGANTIMNLSFEHVNVTYNNASTSWGGDNVFTYQYVSGISTFITSWNNTLNPLPGYPQIRDQRSEWNSNPPYLHFNVGNVSINQTWQCTFRLMVKKEGNINIFDDTSAVTFNGTEGVLTSHIPDTFLTAIANMTSEETAQAQVDVAINGTNDQGPGTIGDFLDVYWNLNYTGTKTVEQKLYYQFSPDNIVWSGTWLEAGIYPTGAGPLNQSYTGLIDVREKSGWMRIMVTAKEQTTGGGYDEDIWPQAIQIGPQARPNIIIT